ncbi:MAG: hypothetical protein M3128_09475 [Verrucomicrobiota bacterium]|nr:hypothetical protein [Verrucomicrobiota bacterium]
MIASRDHELWKDCFGKIQTDKAATNKNRPPNEHRTAFSYSCGCVAAFPPLVRGRPAYAAIRCRPLSVGRLYGLAP